MNTNVPSCQKIDVEGIEYDDAEDHHNRPVCEGNLEFHPLYINRIVSNVRSFGQTSP